MNKALKLVLGVVTILPVVYCIYFVYQFINFQFMYNDFDYVVTAHVVLMFLYAALEVFYIIHIVKASHLPSNQKIMWLLIVIFLTFIGMPVYWYFQIWKHEKLMPDKDLEQLLDE